MATPFIDINIGQQFRDLLGNHLLKIEGTTRIDNARVNCVRLADGKLMFARGDEYCELVSYRVRPMVAQEN